MREAAEALRLTAQDLRKLGVCDHIIPEPSGGAQRDREQTVENVRKSISELLGETSGQSGEELRKSRRQKYLKMGSHSLV